MSLMQTAPMDPMDRASAVALRKNRVSFVPTMWAREAARQAARSAKKGAKKVGEQVARGVTEHFGEQGVKEQGNKAMRALFGSPENSPNRANDDTPFGRRGPIRDPKTHLETEERRQQRKENGRTWVQEQLDKALEGGGDGRGDGGGESKQQRVQLPKIE